MEIYLPTTLDEALEIEAQHPEALPIAGGTDVMVDINFNRRRPEAMIDVSHLPELQRWGRENGSVFLGAGVTYAEITRDLRQFVPLAQAARTVGSPQIRNRGTVGGNLATASPAGDTLPVLAAYGAEIVLAAAGGRTRSLTWNEFLVGTKRTALAPGELILGARWRVVSGPGSFSKIGTRNAMVISLAGLCLVVDEEARAIRVALGSVAPTVVRAPEAEAFAAAALEDAGLWGDPGRPFPDSALHEFGRLVARAARPIDDVRGTAAYRRHACEVLGRRSLAWAVDDRRSPAAAGDASSTS